MIYEREVYYLLAAPSLRGAADALMAVDPGTHRSFLFDAARAPDHNVLDRGDLTRMAGTVRAVLVGAFDGEGYLFMFEPRLYRELLALVAN